MNSKITFIFVLLLSGLFSKAQVTPTLIHNDLAGGVQFDDGMDMEIYNNEMYISITSANKIVKVDISSSNNTVVDVVTGLSSPTGLTVVGNELYFLQRNNAMTAPSSGKLCKISLTVSNPPVVDLFTGLMYPIELEVNGTNAYVSEAYIDGTFELDHMEMSLVTLSGTPAKTVLHNTFYSIDDFEYKDNFLYIIEWPGETFNSKILKLNVSTGTPTVPTLYYDDVPEDFFFKGAIAGNYMYLNNDNTPSVVKGVDLTAGVPTTTVVASPFEFSSNDVNIGEMVVDGANNLYVFGDYFDGMNSTYLLYKVNLNLLGTDDFNNSTKIALYPNPSSDEISFLNLEASSEYEIYSMDGRYVSGGTVNPMEDINVSELSTGVYTIALEGMPFKFVKE